MQMILKALIIFLTLIISNLAYTTPWFTGPLLAPSGQTIPLGHANAEIYGFDTRNNGVFNRHWKLINTPAAQSLQVNPLLSYGLADGVDAQLNLPYAVNSSQHRTSQHIGDTAILVGFQAYRQKPSTWLPDLRVTIQEVFPSGRFERLGPGNNGVDATGTGSYQTALNLNFQDLSQPFDSYYLRTRVSLAYIYSNAVSLHGLSIHGGTRDTKGTIHFGDLFGADIASEFTVTQHWVAVMEAYYFYREASQFKGFVGFDEKGNKANIGHGTVNEISMAPAIEYNFTANYGIIAGVWFVVRGKDAPDFISTVVAFNAYW